MARMSRTQCSFRRWPSACCPDFMLRRICVLAVGGILYSLAGLAEQAPGGAASGELPRIQPVPLSGRTQSGSVTSVETPAPGQGNSVNTLNPSIQIQGVYQGSVQGANPPASSISL